MAKRSKKRKSGASAAEGSAERRPPNPGLKSEVAGLLLIAAGFLLGLSILSYHQTDPVGFLGENNSYQVRNWLGIFGSTISTPLFQWTFGYPIIILPLSIMLLGFNLLLRKPVRALYFPLVLIFMWGFFISVVLAMPESIRTSGGFHSFYPSGFLGGLTAAYLIRFFGKFGSFFIVTVAAFILIVITFRIRISTLSTHLYIILKSLSGTVKKTSRAAVASVGLFTAWVSKKLKSRKKVEKPVSGSSPELEELATETQRLSPKDGKEPDTKEEIETEPLEIVNHQKQSMEDYSDKKDQGGKIITLDDTKQEVGSDSTSPEFEIQEAHQEKELDYDALIRDSLSKYQFPSSEMLIEHDSPDFHYTEEELKANAKILEETLAQFGVKASVNRVVEGPVITLYEVKPAQGVKISQIVGLSDDLALAMRAKGIRMIAPIPGKAAIGIEIPNRHPSTVYFKSIVRSETFINFNARLPIGIGKTISGEVYCADLTRMPHLLMAGATGSGKSVGINTILASLLYRIPPSDLKFVMIDPKKLELSIYARLKDHYLATCSEIDEIVITHPQNAILILRSVVNEMEKRYDKLAMLGVREISHYNQKIEEYHKNGETSEEFRKLPYLVVIIDELADLILSATREVEEPITRLAQMARAVGIHLIMATQRPSVDILTGLIKANFPARIAYQVATRPDSKVILDMYGAEKLIGDGDMLFMPPGKVKPLRLQNALITTEEVDRMIKHIRKQPKFPPYELKITQLRDKGPGTSKIFERDELFEQAKQIVIRYQQGSVSLLQRKLKIGYARAARIIDELEEAGIVSAQTQEGKAREVLVSEYSPDSSK